ncbi:MAG: group 1 glycosyl [Geobacteraceae bacterium]|nr:MAG: group 1 glycosyl [Geobacteraceae bacterium]
MKVLVVTNLFPTERKPQWGTFVKEQVDSLCSAFPDELQIDVYLVDGSLSKVSYVKALFELPKVVKSGKYDVVHVHYGLTLLALLLVKAPIVATFHGSDLLRQPVGFLSRILAKKADRVIVVSENLRSALGYGAIIPCGIVADRFLLPQKWKYDNPSGELRVLFPANSTVPVKNYPLFAEVCRALTSRGYKVREVHLSGVPREQVPQVFWDSDVMLLTSHSEGSPTVIKEAIAAKLPFVSVDVGDARSWASKIDFGAVTESREPSHIADLVSQLLNKIHDRSALVNTHLLDQLDSRSIACRIKAIYSELSPPSLRRP